MKIKIIFLFLITNLLFFSSWAEKIYLKNGKILEGVITSHNKEKVTIVYEGMSLTYWLNEVEKIEGEKAIPLPDRPINEIFAEISPAIVTICNITKDKTRLSTGFVVREDGVIVTTFHAVSGAENLKVILSDGFSYPVTDIMDYSLDKNICVVKIETKGLNVVSLGDSDLISKGNKVAIVATKSLDVRPEQTIIEGEFRDRVSIFNERFLQYKAEWIDTFEGCALLDMRAKVIGLVSYIKNKEKKTQLAMPINVIKKIVMTTYPKMTVEQFLRKINRVYSLLSLGIQQYISGDIKSGLQSILDAVSLDPNCIDAYRYLGKFYMILGYTNEAISMYNKALSKDPNNTDIYIELGSAYLDKGNATDALIYLKQAVDLKPADIFALDRLALAYYKNGQLEEAIKKLEEAMQIDPNAYILYADLGLIYFKKFDYDKAITLLKKSLELEASNPEAYYNLSLIYFDKGQYDFAVRYCDQARKFGKIIPSDYINEIKPYRKERLVPVVVGQGEIPLTENDFQVIRKLDPESSYYVYQAYSGYFQEGRDAKFALENIDKALAKVKGNAYNVLLKISLMISFDSAINYKRKMLIDKAIRYYEQTLATLKFFQESNSYKELTMRCYYELGTLYLEKGALEKVKKLYGKLRILGTYEADSLAKRLYDMAMEK